MGTHGAVTYLSSHAADVKARIAVMGTINAGQRVGDVTSGTEKQPNRYAARQSNADLNRTGASTY